MNLADEKESALHDTLAIFYGAPLREMIAKTMRAIAGYDFFYRINFHSSLRSVVGTQMPFVMFPHAATIVAKLEELANATGPVPELFSIFGYGVAEKSQRRGPCPGGHDTPVIAPTSSLAYASGSRATHTPTAHIVCRRCFQTATMIRA
ncbi:MAG: hypothetical protein JO347_10475, partial [Candidatus Eremiobacteraeota bacterium]|nr:hypothetical protein [Candidatus Eremiobacteraeota bacterium]